MPRKSSASRSRVRRIGLLGLLLTTLLTPAGIIVGTVTAAALIGGAFHLNHAAPEAPVTPPRLLAGKAGNLQHLSIERDGKPVTLVMAEDEIGTGGGVGSFDPASPLFAGLGGNSPARHGAAREDIPSGGFVPGGGSIPGGTAPNPSYLVTPPGSGHAPGSGSSPNGVPTGGTPPSGPYTPPVTGGSPLPTGNGDTGTPPGEGDAPTKPDEDTPTVTRDVPPPATQPTKGLPEETLPALEMLPGIPIAPLAGHPLDTQTSPQGTQRGTQPNAVPEPSMLGLMLLGGAALIWSGRRRAYSLSPA